jgi:hypothetical protein
MRRSPVRDDGPGTQEYEDRPGGAQTMRQATGRDGDAGNSAAG